MADKYIALINGVWTEVEATVVSSGVGNAGDIVALASDGKLDVTVLPTGVGPDTASIVASENLSAGDLVNVWNDSGTPKVRKADASNGYTADGFVLASATSGNAATVYFEGTMSGLTSLTIGARYYLSATAGAATATPVSTSGYLSQYIGKAISATAISFEPSDYVVLA